MTELSAHGYALPAEEPRHERKFVIPFEGMVADPETAQFSLPVEKYVEILAALKPRFIHHPRSKELIRDLFRDLECDLDSTYFDVPRLRTMTPIHAIGGLSAAR